MPNNDKDFLAPGSREALDAGCRCPVLDNGRGRGLYTDKDGKTHFVFSQDCPLHGWKEEKDERQHL